MSYSQGAGWLTVSAAKSGEGQQLRNTVSGAGMQPGTYAATVDVSVAGASNSPQSYVVFLTVTNQLGDGGRLSDPDGLPDAGPGSSGAGLASRTLAGGCTMARAGTPREAQHWPTLRWIITVVLCASFYAVPFSARARKRP